MVENENYEFEESQQDENFIVHSAIVSDRRYQSAPKGEILANSTVNNKPPVQKKTLNNGSVRASLKSEETPRFNTRDEKFKQNSRLIGSPRVDNSQSLASSNRSPSSKENVQTKKRFSPQSRPISQPPLKMHKQSSQTSEKKARHIPRYLKDVDSKIRSDVLKDIAQYKTLVDISTISNRHEDLQYKNVLDLSEISNHLEDSKTLKWEDDIVNPEPKFNPSKNLNLMFNEASKINFGVQTENP